MPAKQAPYSEYARHYDQIGQGQFGTISAQQLLGLLGSGGVQPRCVLDLACGTGAATLEFARSGMNATGLDLSPAMLTIARASSEQLGLAIEWLEGDMTSFVADRQFDLCTCFYDAINYLPDLDSVTGFTRSSLAALNPGGHLAFDINTRRKLRDHWGSMTLIAADDDERFIVYRSWFDEGADMSPLVITGFTRRDDGTWRRFDEEHIEHAFSIADLVQMLESVGFVEIRVIDWREANPGEFHPGTEDAFRVLFLARKPSPERSEP